MRLLFLLMLFFTACSDTDKSAIIKLLETRDANISQQNIAAYASLLADSYLQGEGAEKVKQMKVIFSQFDAVKMTSRDREIRILDDHSAICEQTYTLKVLADNEWREIVQREQLTLEFSAGSWKINGGL